MPKFYWVCRIDDALCSSDESKCWNCNTPYPRGKNQRAEVRAEIIEAWCDLCKKTYKSIQHPRLDCPTLCPWYFEHHGNNAYYPPNIPASFWLEVNVLEYDKESGQLIRLKEV